MTSKPAGVILAGGRSSRMGGRRKALMELNGLPLLTHVSSRLQAYTEPLILNCQIETSDFDHFGLKQVADLLPGFRGPLMGLYSALRCLSESELSNGLILCPCDAPFIPDNLVSVLLDAVAVDGENKPVAVVSYQGVLQPTFSLWQNHHLGMVKEAVIGEGRGGLKHLLLSLPHVIVEWDTAEPSPFFNVNTPEELDSAAVWLDRMQA